MSEIPHYNAFITYRHHPQDIAVAEAIHKGLEHFKVPRSLKKQGKSIERIFRDKEELPITSSLNDTITQALESSDFQIVICSTHLKDSFWVPREIETFLKTHTKDQILTVIVDGEPEDVIPEILTYRDVTDPITGETVREPLEPLSCDWRLDKRKAKKVELPRLAAVLLGCAYNDLIQRQKQYQMRRLAIGASIGIAASLGLAAYFLHTSVQIQKNLNQSLLNQSQYLASASQERFEAGDRLTAIALALEALPDEDGDRPYSASAERALSEALKLYDPNGEITAVGVYTARSLVSDFILSDDGSLLYILDSQQEVTTWDTESFEKLSAFSLEQSYAPLYTDAQGNLLTLDGEFGSILRAFSPQGELLWQREDIEVDSLAFLDGKETLLATTSTMDDAHYLLHLDPGTGEELTEPLRICAYEDCLYVKLASQTYWENQPYLLTLVDTQESDSFFDADLLSLFDPLSGALTPLVPSEDCIYCASTLPNGQTLLLLSDGSGLWNGIIAGMTIASPASADLCCFDPQGQLMWSTQLSNHLFSNVNTIAAVGDTGNIFVQYGNNLCLLDGQTGGVLAQLYASSYPLWVELDGTEKARCLFGDGSMGFFSFDTQELYTSRYAESGLSNGVVYQGTYVSQSLSMSVTKYMSTADENYKVIDGSSDSLIRDSAVTDRYLVTDNYDTLSLYDLAARKHLWTDESWAADGYYTLLGFNADSSRIYAFSPSQGVLIYDRASGNKSCLSLPEAEDGILLFGDQALLQDDLLYVQHTFLPYDNSGAQVNLMIWDLLDGSFNLQPIVPEELEEDWDAYGDYIRFLYADDTRLLLQMPTGQLYEYLLQEQTLRALGYETAKSPVFLPEPEPYRLYLAQEGQVLLLDENYDILQSFALPEARAVSLFRHEDLFCVLGDDGYVYQFDSDGQLLVSSGQSLYTSFFSAVKDPDSLSLDVSWAITPDGHILLGASNMGNLIPVGADGYCASIHNFLCYHAASDSFISVFDGDLIAYSRLSLPEVMARGRETLGSFTLTEDQKTTYGLQD